MSSRTAPARWARRSTTPSAACSSSCAGPGIAMASGRSRLTVASSPILASRPKKAAPGSAAPARSRVSAMRSTTRAVTTASNSASLVGKCRYTVPAPTPARAAISSSGTSYPDAAKASAPARRTFSLLRRASARVARSAIVTNRGDRSV